MKKIVAVVKEPYKKAHVVNIDDDLKTLQNIVGGCIAAGDLPNMEDIYGFCNDEGLLIGLEPNVYRPQWKDALFGPLVFVGAGDEGESVSLKEEQINRLMEYFQKHSVNSFGEMYTHVQTGFKHYKKNESVM